MQTQQNIKDRFQIVPDIIDSLNNGKSLDESLTEVCNLIPGAFKQDHGVSVRISSGTKHFTSRNFKETPWVEKHKLEISEVNDGCIEVFYPVRNKSDDSGFLRTIAAIVSGEISKHELKKLTHDNTERLKELKGISRTAEILNKNLTLEQSLQAISNFLPEAWQYPDYTVARLTFDGNSYTSRNFMETPWLQKQTFKTPDNKKGSIEIYYLRQFPAADEGPFLKEERKLIDNLAALISGTLSKEALQQVLHQNTERLKELRGISQTSAILKQHDNLEDALQEICNILPEAWQYPEFTDARINYENKTFTSNGFLETPWSQKQEFEAPENKRGTIEIFYRKEFPPADEGPFLKEERNLLVNLSNLIAGSAIKEVFNKLQAENKERLKELRAINQTSQIINKCLTEEETLKRICNILPKSWQYPEHTAARIRYEGHVYSSRKFTETPWFQREGFVTIDNKKGIIEIYYLKELPEEDEGPFLKEERHLLVNIARFISGYLNNCKGRDIFQNSQKPQAVIAKTDEYRNSLIKNKQPLQLFFNKQILDKYIYLDMMKYKVKHILFVATLYDAFTLENEDSFFEQFMGEIYQYSLFSLPRITAVTSGSEALELLGTTYFDLVVLMVGMDTQSPVRLSEKIKAKLPNVPVYLLLNQKSNVKYFEELVPSIPYVDKVFVWNGQSQIMFAIVKSIEDNANVENDTKIGLVRVILLIEDSPLYYSKYLQILYSIVFGQIQQILPEVEKNELNKISKMRSRPKILLAKNYEEATYIFNKYKDFMLCVISDMEFDHGGKPDKNAGIKFIKYVKSHIINLPIILQSSDKQNEKIAENLSVHFINKNSQSLYNDLKNFLTFYLGFGDFIFRDKEGNPIAVAKSLREFEDLLHHVPEESLYFHGIDNQFSLWLMARGEIQLARTLNPVKISDFPNMQEFRQHFINSIRKYKEEKKKGKVLSFDETAVLDEKNIVSFATGSLGGKGRGLAFINTLIYNLEFGFSREINIRTPITAIIGTDEFELFMDHNQLYDKVFIPGISYTEIKQHFMNAELSYALIKKLEVFVNQIQKPIAVRSSSISEDSVHQPFAGVFDTFIVPNKDNKEESLSNLIKAIKMVYASVFSDDAKNYFKAIHHRVEDEKMAVILQELVGTRFGDYYYPHISGTAQSYNYYPVAHMKPEEGFAVAAVGLGYYVVGGSKSYRFSPKYPKIEIYTPKDLLNSTQVNFYALDLSRQDVDYINEGELASVALLDISEAEKHGSIKHIASVYDPENDRIESGLSTYGPRIINFGDILKFHYIPLAETIDFLLGTIKEALGTPVEIEYAVNLTKTDNGLPSFYLLQIKPLVSQELINNVVIEDPDMERSVLYTRSSLGNGAVNSISDVIYIDVDQFNKLKTIEMVKEIEMLNQRMVKEDRQYILIGPGRWGTRDPYLGLPVVWSQISNAKIIVEISLENYPLDSSLGSHFFHNVVSMNIGYLSVLDTSKTDFIRWDLLERQTLVNRTRCFKHVRFEKPLKILMNGKKRIANILLNS